MSKEMTIGNTERYAYCPDEDGGPHIYDKANDFLYPVKYRFPERLTFDDWWEKRTLVLEYQDNGHGPLDLSKLYTVETRTVYTEV